MEHFQEIPLVIGIGAQKSGTSWLGGYFMGRRDFFFTPLKEIHYFDAKFLPETFGQWNNKYKDQFQNLEKEISDQRDAKLLRRLQMLDDRVKMPTIESGYVDHFRRNVRPHHQAFGEFTPSYALLPKEGFEAIKETHPKVKLLYLMRDPLDRLCSSLSSNRLIDSEEKFHNVFSKEVNHERSIYFEMSRYDKVIKKLETVFDQEDISFSFYEDLFNDASIKKICDFIGIPFVPASYTQRVNRGSRLWEFSSQEKQVAQELLADTYEFCEDRFGAMVSDLWHFGREAS